MKLWPLLAMIPCLGAGCAAREAPPPRPTERAAERDEELHVEGGPTSVESEIGGMSQDGVERTLAKLHPRFVRCVEQASERLSAIGGRVSVRMRVDPGGSVRWAYLSDTTLGDREAESCVLELVKTRRWPRPKSGDGLAETSFEVQAAEQPTEISGARASWFAQRAGSATAACRKGHPAGFVATAYVSATGEVLSAGVAPPNEAGEAASDCIASRLRELRARGLFAGRVAPAKISVKIP